MKIRVNIFKILLTINVILPIIILITFYTILKSKFNVYNSTNIILFFIIEIINISLFIKFVILNKHLFKKIFILIYVIIIFFIPIYHTGYTYATNGKNSHLMGAFLRENYRNIYFIDITDFIKIFK